MKILQVYRSDPKNNPEADKVEVSFDQKEKEKFDLPFACQLTLQRGGGWMETLELGVGTEQWTYTQTVEGGVGPEPQKLIGLYATFPPDTPLEGGNEITISCSLDFTYASVD